MSDGVTVFFWILSHLRVWDNNNENIFTACCQSPFHFPALRAVAIAEPTQPFV